MDSVKSPLPLRRGDYVEVTFEGRTLPAMVTLASENGKSLMLMFDGMLGGYAGMMPVLWSQDHYEDLIVHATATLVCKGER